MPKIYTKAGDRGRTSLYDGDKVTKSSVVLDIIGSIDELSCRIGLVHAHVRALEDVQANCYQALLDDLAYIQSRLQDIGSHFATYKPDFVSKLRAIDEGWVTSLEMHIDSMDDVMPPLTVFILPGTTVVDAHIHLCRTQTRAVERLITSWSEISEHGKDERFLVIQRFFNRLSDYFFVLARFYCHSQSATSRFYQNMSS